MDYTNFVKEDCKHNQVLLEYPSKGATLRGFSGSHHNSIINTLKGVNLYLAPSSVPHCYLYSNNPADLCTEPPTHRILFFPIEDQHVPRSKAEFAILLDILLKELNGGGQVNVSCIGGHGRTGLVLAMLHGLMEGSKTPIEDIRASYCNKAVESYEQECFIHEWLGLPKPKEYVRPCQKCGKADQELLPSGRRDTWCIACNADWKRKQEEFKSQPIANVRAFPTVNTAAMVSGSGVKCRKCWVRNPQSDSLWCLTCQFSLEPKDLPASQPEGWSKKAWKRLLKSVQGHAHEPSPSTALVPSGSANKAQRIIDAVGMSEAEMARHAYLKEIPLQRMTETEWQDFLRLEFGSDKAARA